VQPRRGVPCQFGLGQSGLQPINQALLDWSLPIPRSSMAEHPTINRQVAGSNPAAGAHHKGSPMDVAVIGAAGACGRQSVMQMLARSIVPHDSTIQLVGNPKGRSATELWGVRADLRDAFDTWAPTLEVVLDPSEINADIVVMMAGQTVSADPGAPTDRAELGSRNADIFSHYAEILAQRDDKPIVVIQSNPVELAVEIFAEQLGDHHVLAAAGWSDSKRFSREVGRDLGLPRHRVQGFVVGQHGNHLVPVWSLLTARGVTAETLAETVAQIRAGRELADLPGEIADGRTHMLDMVRRGDVADAFAYVESLPADLRAFIKPFFTHFTAGRTTEAVTAQAAVDIVDTLVHGDARVYPAQVRLTGQFHDLVGVTAVPVILGPGGWSAVVDVHLADDEMAALRQAVDVVGQLNAEDRSH
jgi:malate dehydrogenase